MWREEDRPAILPKTKGSGIMVSEFVEKHGGCLQHTDAELVLAKERFPDIKLSARQLLEYGDNKEGHWTGDRFMEQVKNTANIAEFKKAIQSSLIKAAATASSMNMLFLRRTFWSRMVVHGLFVILCGHRSPRGMLQRMGV